MPCLKSPKRCINPQNVESIGWRGIVNGREALAGVPGVGGEQDQVVRSSKIRLQDDAGVAWELYWVVGLYFLLSCGLDTTVRQHFR